MKKILTVLLGVFMVLSLVGCSNKAAEQEQETLVDPAPTAANTYEDFLAAELDTELELLMSVQCAYIDYKGNGYVFLQDDNGATFGYCEGADETLFNAMTPGTLVRVKGYKGEWSGELELIDATYEIIAGAYDGKNYDAIDLTDKVGDNDTLATHMNKKSSFKGLTVKEWLYNWDGKGERETSDIYLTCTCPNGNDIQFVIKTGMYDCNSELFQFVETLQAGDVVDVESFMYWYEGPQPYVNAITKA